MKAKFLLLPAFVLAIGVASAQSAKPADTTKTHEKHQKHGKHHSDKKADDTQKKDKKKG